MIVLEQFFIYLIAKYRSGSLVPNLLNSTISMDTGESERSVRGLRRVKNCGEMSGSCRDVRKVLICFREMGKVSGRCQEIL